MAQPDIDFWGLREEFGDLRQYGLPFPLPRELRVKVARAALVVAAADGHVSSAERAVAIERAQRFGMDSSDVEALRTWDPAGVSIEDAVDASVRPMARMAIYGGIMTARADGLHDAERAALERMARRLGLSPDIVPALEGVLVWDDALTRSRHLLLRAPGEATRAGSGAPITAGDAARRRVFGPGAGGPMSREFAANIGKAVLLIAAGDGKVSLEEATYYHGFRKAMGVPDAMMADLDSFDPRRARFDEVVTADLASHARMMLYTALKVASSDGFAPTERQMLERAGAKLQLDPAFLVALEHQVRMEAAARDARIALLRP